MTSHSYPATIDNRRPMLAEEGGGRSDGRTAGRLFSSAIIDNRRQMLADEGDGRSDCRRDGRLFSGEVIRSRSNNLTFYHPASLLTAIRPSTSMVSVSPSLNTYSLFITQNEALSPVTFCHTVHCHTPRFQINIVLSPPTVSVPSPIKCQN